MSADLVTTAAAGTPEWHASRTRALGGSEIAAVVGLSPWQSAFGLWHLKRGTCHRHPSGTRCPGASASSRSSPPGGVS